MPQIHKNTKKSSFFFFRKSSKINSLRRREVPKTDADLSRGQRSQTDSCQRGKEYSRRSLSAESKVSVMTRVGGPNVIYRVVFVIIVVTSA